MENELTEKTSINDGMIDDHISGGQILSSWHPQVSFREKLATGLRDVGKNTFSVLSSIEVQIALKSDMMNSYIRSPLLPALEENSQHYICDCVCRKLPLLMSYS